MDLSIAQRIAKHFLAQDLSANTYNIQLAYEALLLMADKIDGVHAQVESVIKHLGINTDSVLRWQDQQFHDLSYAWFKHQGQLDAYSQAYLACTDQWMEEIERRPNGCIIHNCKHQPRGSLLDMLQAYLLRLARAATLSGDKRYIDELVQQMHEHHREICNPSSGCYHQGRGWLKNDGLSPGCWSRGQGWLLHGLVHCLPLLKAWPHAQRSIASYTKKLLDHLQPLQAASGLWHQLINRPNESFADSSGSALILEAYVLYSKHSKSRMFQDTIDKAVTGLSACVDEDGVVDLACKGPGTIWEIEPWRMTHAPKGDEHGVFSTLFACAAFNS